MTLLRLSMAEVCPASTPPLRRERRARREPRDRRPRTVMIAPPAALIFRLIRHPHGPVRPPASGRLSRQRGISLLELMIVLMVVSLMVGITYPSIGAGLDSLRLRSAADQAASLLTQGIARVERTQSPLELLADRAAGRLVLRDLTGRFAREQKLDAGIRIAEILPPLPAAGEETSRLVLLAPGEPFPAIGLVLANDRGQRRLVRIDPLTAMAVVETPPDRVSEEETR